MICQKCGYENQENSLFCNKCGEKLISNEENVLKKTKRKINLFNKRKNIITLGISLVVIFMITIGIINNPVFKFKNQIKNGKCVEAVKLYNNKIRGNSDKEKKINLFLKDEVEKIQVAFMDEKIDYDKTTDKLKMIKDTGLLSDVVDISITKINKLNNSRIAFKKAEAFIKNDDFINGIKEYRNVISEDKNYKEAKQQIKSNEKKYKQQVLKKVENFNNKKDYENALSVLAEATSVLPNDTELATKNTVYKKLNEKKIEQEEKQKMDELKSKQEVKVINASVTPDYFKVNDQAKVIVKNNTNKVVKEYNVGILMYDSNGYPLKSGIIAGENQVFKGNADSVNIQPGQSSGEDYVWDLYTNHGTIKKIIACVMDVEYYDGSKWTNEYYKYWEKEYAGKQYK